jgi:PPE-repeat protein
MYNYAGRSANISAVKPFASAPHMTNPAGMAQQAASVTGTSAGAAQNTLHSAMSQITSALGKLSTGMAAAEPATPPADPVKSALSSGLVGYLGDIFTFYAPFSTTFYNTEGLPFFSAGLANTFVTIAKATGALGNAANAAAPAAVAVPPAVAAPPALGAGLAGGGGSVAGALGHAASVGRLSVPPVWGESMLGQPHHGAVLPVSNIREAPDARPGNMFGGMPLAGGGDGGTGRGPRYGMRLTVMPRPPAAG